MTELESRWSIWEKVSDNPRSPLHELVHADHPAHQIGLFLIRVRASGNFPHRVVPLSKNNPLIYLTPMVKDKMIMRLVPLLKIIFLGFLVSFSLQGGLYSEELGLDSQTRANLDAWELNRLESADAAWVKAEEKADKSKKRPKNLFSAANAAYQLFIEEFPRSPAVAYALFRQGRSFHLDNKRDSARQIYQDIIEFFPDQTVYATAALWFKEKVIKRMEMTMMPSVLGLKLPKTQPIACNHWPLMPY